MIIFYLRLCLYYIFKTHYPITTWGEQVSPYHRTSDDTRNVKKVVFMCDGFKIHGGLTDRMRGLLTTYLEAKRRNLPFYISWTKPFLLEEFLVPPENGWDWRIATDEIGYNYVESFPVIIHDTGGYWLNIFKKYIFKYSFIGKKTKLVYTNIMYEKEKFPLLYQELFKPSTYLQYDICFHLKKIGGKFWSYTFRFGNFFGDFKDLIGYPLEGEEKQLLLRKNINELKKLMCELPEGVKALVTSDSFFFLNQVENIDNRIYVVKEKILHMDYYQKDETKKEIWRKSFLDQNLIMKAEKVYLLKTEGMYKSGFPEFASLIGNCEYVYHEF